MKMPTVYTRRNNIYDGSFEGKRVAIQQSGKGRMPLPGRPSGNPPGDFLADFHAHAWELQMNGLDKSIGYQMAWLKRVL
ncbi:MAG TPA: hypothetical protein VKA69_02460, partial [Desulfobacteria bacterium]|nr:hypothetical protein [Desulfobacteria bacterium]